MSIHTITMTTKEYGFMKTVTVLAFSRKADSDDFKILIEKYTDLLTECALELVEQIREWSEQTTVSELQKQNSPAWVRASEEFERVTLTNILTGEFKDTWPELMKISPHVFYRFRGDFHLGAEEITVVDSMKVSPALFAGPVTGRPRKRWKMSVRALLDSVMWTGNAPYDYTYKGTIGQVILEKLSLLKKEGAAADNMRDELLYAVIATGCTGRMTDEGYVYDYGDLNQILDKLIETVLVETLPKETTV